VATLFDVGGIGSNLQRLIQSTDAIGARNGLAQRQSMRFSSRYRSYLKNLRFQINAGQIAPTSATASILAPNSTALLEVVPLPINPLSIAFSGEKRITKQDTRDGSVYWHFSDERGRDDDVLVLTFRINTGTLDRRGIANEDGEMTDENGALGNLLAFHNLRVMASEPNLLPDHTQNVIRIAYVSPLFPQMLDLSGFFLTRPEFTEEGTSPHDREYTFQFAVTDMDPPIDLYLEGLFAVLSELDLTINPDAALVGANTRLSTP
jgi:hypothetical protein